MKSMKRNGFSQPFHRLQVASWLAIALLSALFYALVALNLQDAHRTLVLVCYSASFGLSLALGLVCTLKDPSDIAVKMKYIQKSYVSEFSSSLFPRLCTRCNTHVGAQSKHCNKCNRCTEKFDHHCNWLNNCIGGPNYRYFILLLCTMEVWVGLQLAVTMYVMMAVFASAELGTTVMDKYDVGDRGYCYIVMLLVTAVACVSIAVGNGYLLVFHCWLKWKGISTYEFIVARRQKKSRVEQSPDAQFSNRKSENSSVVVELNLSGDVKVDVTPELRDHHEATPSAASDFELKKLFSRTIDNSSLPSQDKATDMDFTTSQKRRKARDSIFAPGEDFSAGDNCSESPELPTRHKTGPLPLRPDFP